MDVIFDNHSGKAFCIEVGFFDTVLEIKQKVQKYQGIPVTSQTLVFNGKVLEDERDVEYCEILHNSLIQLLVASDSDDDNYKQQPQVNEQQKKQTSSSKETQLKVNGNAPSSEALVLLEMDANDTVLPLKEMVQDQMEVEPVPVNRLVVQSDRSQRTENNVVDANIMPPPPLPTSYGKRAEGITTDSEKLKLTENKNADVNNMSPPTSSGKGAEGDTSNMLKPSWNDVKILPRPTSSRKRAAGDTTGSNTLKPMWNDVKIIPRPMSSGKVGAGDTTGSNTLKPKWNDVKIMPWPMSSGKGAAGATSTASSNMLKPTWKDENIMPPPMSSGKREAEGTAGSIKLKLKWKDTCNVYTMPPPTSSGKGEAGANSTTGSNMLKPTWKDVNTMPPPTSLGKGEAGANSTTASNMLKPTWKDVNTMPPPTSSGKGEAEGTAGSNTLKLKWKDTCNVDIMPPPTSSGKGAAEDKAITSTGKLKLLVLPWHGTKKVAVEVNATDNVEDLRKELQKLQKKVLLPLPEGGYFFIHKQSVMDEDRSFKWHQVAQGDTIEIFSGYVTRG